MSRTLTAVLAMMPALACRAPAADAPGPSPGPTEASAPAAPEPFADGPPPHFWSWQEPLGPAALRPDIVRMVIERCGRGTPEDVADRMIAAIRTRRLPQGRVGLLLQHFGMGHGDPAGDSGLQAAAPALFRHWCDGVAHRMPMLPQPSCERLAPHDAAAQWWMTLFSRHGIDECSAWMRRFIARYRQVQAADPALPDPDRFHFDSERRVVPQFSPRGTVEAFAAMRDDPRWDTEPMPGFGDRTMADLFAASGPVPFDPGATWYHPRNQAWSAWYNGICITVADAAMNAAAYEPIRRAWPRARSGNYRAGLADGAGTPPRLRPPREPGRPWMRSLERSFADLQSPELYHAPRANISATESLDQATLRLARAELDTTMHSFGGPRRTIVPWVEVAGCRRPHGGEPTTVSADLLREVLALCRSRGIHEMILWSNGTTQESTRPWSDTVRAIDQVWAASLEMHRVLTGSVVGPDDTARLRFAERAVLSIASGTEAPAQDRRAGPLQARSVRIALIVRTGPTLHAVGPRIAVRLEADGVPSDARVTLALDGRTYPVLRDPDPHGFAAGRFIGRAVLEPPATLPRANLPAADGGEARAVPVIVMRLDIHHDADVSVPPFRAELDLVQVIATDEAPTRE
ncbi:MAG: hypothetical protein KF817_01865 [Phycisphaeraceae bacterium]|nr:hypothetical protein [Phycisphaeraceae bacterium]